MNAQQDSTNAHSNNAVIAEAQRLEFARENLRSTQQLIQFLDQKSYLVLVITGVTSAAFFSTVGAFLGRPEALISLRTLMAAMAIWFMVEAGIVVVFLEKHSRRGGQGGADGSAGHGIPAPPAGSI